MLTIPNTLSLNSGATHNIFQSADELTDIKQAKLNISITDGTIIKSHLKGIWRKTQTGVPIYAYICPKLSEDLVSIVSLTVAGFDVVFSGQYAMILDNDQIIDKTTKRNGVYRISNLDNSSKRDKDNMWEWQIQLNY